MKQIIDVLMVEDSEGVRLYTRQGDEIELRIHSLQYDRDGDFGLIDFVTKEVEPGWANVIASNEIKATEFNHYVEVAKNPIEDPEW